MGVITFLLLICCGFGLVQNNMTTTLSTENSSSDQCNIECAVTSQPNKDNDGSFVIFMSENISYIYIIEYNAFLVINQALQYVVILAGTEGTITFLHANTGFGAITNVETNLVYIFHENLQIFDITSITKENYTVVIEIIEYVFLYNEKVVGQDTTIVGTEIGYVDSTILLYDYSMTTDFSQWVCLVNQTELIELFENSNSEVAEILYQLFASQEFTIEWGPAMYLVVATQLQNSEDQLLFEFNAFAVSIVRVLDSIFNAELMKEYYLILISQESETTDVTIAKYEKLKWAINGVGTTYENLAAAMEAYRDGTVVQTYLNTIVVDNTTSYVTYNSMKNGTWLFRITYGDDQYVQLTASYYDGYMGIFDPSLNYTMVFTNTNKFAFFNHKTANGFIIDGFLNVATYIVNGDEEIINAFAENRYIDGFKLVQSLTEETLIDDTQSFNATAFFMAVQNGEYQEFLDEQQLASFEQDFASLKDDLGNITFDNNYGISNLVIVMLNGPSHEFFEEGFAAMLSKMFYFEISGGRFYRICYAGILENINKEFNEPMFMNTYEVLGKVKKGNKSKDELNKFCEDFVRLSTEPTIDVTREEFTRDGSIFEISPRKRW